MIVVFLFHFSFCAKKGGEEGRGYRKVLGTEERINERGGERIKERGGKRIKERGRKSLKERGGERIKERKDDRKTIGERIGWGGWHQVFYVLNVLILFRILRQMTRKMHFFAEYATFSQSPKPARAIGQNRSHDFALPVVCKYAS